MKPKSILFALSLLLTGSTIYYLFGYKDHDLLNLLAYLLILAGWMILFFKAAGRRLFREKKANLKTDSRRWLIRQSLLLLCYLAFGGLIFGHFMLISDMADQRVANILQTKPTNKVIAIVIALEERKSRGGPMPYAVIKYEAGNKTVTQAIYNQGRRYKVGQPLEIRHSVDYPEMFEVIRQLDNNQQTYNIDSTHRQKDLSSTKE